MGVLVKLALPDQILRIETVHYCIKIENIYVKHDIGRPMVKKKFRYDKTNNQTHFSCCLTKFY